ncbi:ABC transporter permease [Pararobbsia silviterrae]|uniref:ABC transporter permease n=1 Tax=Pararobbsia silviterrae TaxID=1792498 RepID=UPI0019802FE5|nr:ABC transporter permease [Pararobbsia silviterrae]
MIYQILLLGVFLGAWEVAIRRGWIAVFLYGQPSGIWSKGLALIASGALFHDIGITAWETVSGFVIGTGLGSLAGLLLWLSPTAARVLKPYLAAINGLPIISLAPLIIVWFGVGLASKIAVASIITFVVAMISAYAGTCEIDPDQIRLMKSLGARHVQIWRMVIVPGTLPWIASILRLNVGFALIGAVVGEYISSKDGLGYMIYYAGVIYDLNAVWVGIAALMAVALLMYAVVGLLERRMRGAS